MTPGDWESQADLRAFVRGLCARNGPFGGDGIYLYDARPKVPLAWFFNPDGSTSEFCGNGMRCLGRVIMDLRGTSSAVIRGGQREYTVRRAPDIAGVPQVTLEHPPVDFDPPVAAGRGPLTAGRLPELDPQLEFTSVTIPNPHLVAIVDKYVESDLIAMGERLAARRDAFPAGANLSVLLALEPADVFVRTFERGAGLTASCGSGMAAARAVYSRLGLARPEHGVLVRNAGGMAEVSLLVRNGQWCPMLTGNATFAYRADVDPLGSLPGNPVLETFPDEAAAYSALEQRNAAVLRAAGVDSAALPRPCLPG
jgi:diaminopimelate epimerase